MSMVVDIMKYGDTGTPEKNNHPNHAKTACQAILTGSFGFVSS
jgi:hypothetical protein